MFTILLSLLLTNSSFASDPPESDDISFEDNGPTSSDFPLFPEDCSIPPVIQGMYYSDWDKDGYGDPNKATKSPRTHYVACGSSNNEYREVIDPSYVRKAGDCDDGNSFFHPGAPDLLGDMLDQNCDGVDGVKAPISTMPPVDDVFLYEGVERLGSGRTVGIRMNWCVDSDADGFGNVNSCQAQLPDCDYDIRGVLGKRITTLHRSGKECGFAHNPADCDDKDKTIGNECHLSIPTNGNVNTFSDIDVGTVPPQSPE
jgi:hypothetical protein